MTVLIAGIALIVIALALLKKTERSKRNEDGTDQKPPYFRKPALLNDKEQVLFYRLIDALPDHHVLTQVRLADIVGVGKCKNWQSWLNKVSHKSVDFVVCDQAFSVLACIELDGKTHEQEDRQKADAHKDEALLAAGIPMVRIKVGSLRSTAEIRALLEKVVV